MAVPLGPGLVAVDFDRRTVDVESDALGALAAALGPDASPGHLEYRLAQDLQVGGLGHERGEA